MYNDHLSSLQVQSKFKDLEIEYPVWKRILWGLPPGELSFILRASSPTPVNLARWRIQTDPKCPLCGDRRATSQHIINSCQTALNQGRYTWRHDSILYHLVTTLWAYVSTGSTVYVDLEDYIELPPIPPPQSLLTST